MKRILLFLTIFLFIGCNQNKGNVTSSSGSELVSFDNDGNLKVSGELHYKYKLAPNYKEAKAKIYGFKILVDNNPYCVISSNLDTIEMPFNGNVLDKSIPYEITIAKNCIQNKDSINLQITASNSISYKIGTVTETKNKTFSSNLNIDLSSFTENISINLEYSKFYIQQENPLKIKILSKDELIDNEKIKKVIVKVNDKAVLINNSSQTNQITYSNLALNTIFIKPLKDNFKITIEVYIALENGVVTKKITKLFNAIKKQANAENNITGINIKYLPNNISIPEQKKYAFNIQILKNGVQIDDSKVKNIKIRTTNAFIVRLMNNNQKVNSVEFNNSSFVTVTIFGANSGTANLEVESNILVDNNKTVTFYKTIPITITKIAFDNPSLKLSTNKVVFDVNDKANLIVSGEIVVTLSNVDKFDNYQLVYNSINFSSSNSKCIKSVEPQNVSNNNFKFPFKLVIDKECYNSTININITATLKAKIAEETKIYSLKSSVSLDLNTSNNPYVSFINTIDIVTQPVINTISKNEYVKMYIQIKKENKQISENEIAKVILQTEDGSILQFKENNITKNSITIEQSSYFPIIIVGNNEGKTNIRVDVYINFKNGFVVKTIEIPIKVINTQNINDSPFQIKVEMPDSLQVDDYKIINIKLINKKTAKEVNNSLIKKVEVKFFNQLVEINNSSTYEYSASSSKALNIHTKKVAGKETILINAELEDGNVSYKKDFVITGREPHTINLSLVKWEKGDGELIGKFKIFASDKYGNKAKPGSIIHVGLIAGLRKDKNGKYLYVKNNGKIEHYNDTSTKFSLMQNSTDFSNVNIEDTLVILPNFLNEKKEFQQYSGGWIIKNYINDSSLLLENNYTGNTEYNLTFAIGVDRRVFKNNIIGNAYFDSETKEYKINENGVAYFSLHTSPSLIGHDVFLYANSYNKERVGITKRVIIGGRPLNTFLKTNQPFDSLSCVEECDFNFTFYNTIDNSALLDKEFSTINFYFSENCSDIKLLKSNTSTDGIIEIHVKGPCTVQWNKSLIYDY